MVIRNPKEIVYPSGDGKPIADNTLQYQWIVTIQGGLACVFADNPNVFVAADLLWYPVEGNPKICIAPDILTVLGRPKGHRPSWLQWLEDHQPLHIVWEIKSQSNRGKELERKFKFYEQYGVQEYYVYDPDKITLDGFIRQGDRLLPIEGIESGWTSPRLGVRMQIEEELVLIGPDGKRFQTFLELAAESKQEHDRAERAEKKSKRTQAKLKKAEEEAELQREKAKKANQELDRLRRILKAKGIDPDSLNGS